MAQQIPGLATYPALSIGGGYSAGLGLSGFAGGVSAPASRALALLGSAPDGVALDFTDMSCVVRDTVTPANNFSGSPAAWLSYSAPSAKWVLGANGLYASASTLRTAYDANGVALGLMTEDIATTLAAHSRNPGAATWTKVNMYATTDTGVDGVANSGGYIQANAPNATVINQANVAASAACRLAPFIKRVSGSGDLQWTLDGGITWTSFVGITNTFKRIGVGKTVANPQVGFRIVTSGDAFNIDFANGETNLTGSYDTSPVASLATVVTRNPDYVSLNNLIFPRVTSIGSMMIGFTFPQTIITSIVAIIGMSGSDRWLYNNGAEYDGITVNSYPGAGFSNNVINKAGASWNGPGSTIMLAANGLVGASLVYNPSWFYSPIYLGSFGSNNQNSIIRKVLILPVAKSADYLSMLTA